MAQLHCGAKVYGQFVPLSKLMLWGPAAHSAGIVDIVPWKAVGVNIGWSWGISVVVQTKRVRIVRSCYWEKVTEDMAATHNAVYEFARQANCTKADELQTREPHGVSKCQAVRHENLAQESEPIVCTVGDRICLYITWQISWLVQTEWEEFSKSFMPRLECAWKSAWANMLIGCHRTMYLVFLF